MQNPLTDASYETIARVAAEIGENTEDINVLYSRIKQIDDSAECDEYNCTDAAYNAVYMAGKWPSYSVTEMRAHLQNLIDHGFHKCLLSDEQKENFLKWSADTENMPGNATPFEIYYAATPSLLHVLGR